MDKLVINVCKKKENDFNFWNRYLHFKLLTVQNLSTQKCKNFKIQCYSSL